MTVRILVSILFLINCSGKSIEDKKGYTFSKPDEIFELPDKLREVSGIAVVNDSTIACVEDEHGIVYLYNLRQNKIDREILFAPKGDYEDIAIAGEVLYVLRSDGLIMAVSGFNSNPKVRAIVTNLKKDLNVEGLSFSLDKRTLLMASKSEKTIYSFDPIKGKLTGGPIPIKAASGFAPSGLAFHPLTGELYILGTVGKSLLIASGDGTIKKTISLQKNLFKQPEGIAFNASGDLYISNEGREGKANILLFRYKK